MVKRIISLLMIFCLTATLWGCGNKDVDAASSAVSENIISSDEVSSDTSSEEEAYTPDLDSWEMTLVNKWNPLPDGFAPELADTLREFALLDYSKFDARAVDKLDELCKAAKEDGINLIVRSPYRTNATQTLYFENKVNSVMKSNPSWTREQAEVEAATVIARPWTSEHQLGLAVDFNEVEWWFEDTEQFKWLDAHAHEYGFIMRYPEDKQDKTAVIYEPWHYRYVGVENAKAIKESGLCLEEFVELYKNMK